ncbi:mitochondrial fission ELM1 family protein [Siccirubricoccus sp. KC 17139]|uniref:Mitochondrial fission ELM1 family protein n=1 Tax=Siccirubricoccus soli TaxID=2899147 RepID=A0ABT1D144_9PROT|nr:mitochondrial fission ELM1 family protein [Siccirubricoccus soli]MCO6415623.1 mitochondrial fission ELM1 family protein [Siccirubricoccus soli]MCP2681755.1 mitochondrial fission ELM1 family protein [Siccirubricoccus soli]
MTDGIWVLADPRAGTAAQALGIAERLGAPFRTVDLDWGRGAKLPFPWPTLAGLSPAARASIQPPWPRLVLSAGRRAGPVARWLGRRGARLVHCMRPGFGAAGFDLLVIGRHDSPAPAPNLLEILGACHRLSPARLAAARGEWAALADLPPPRVALLVGGKPGTQGPMAPEVAAGIAARLRGFAGSVLATTSRRSGPAAAEAIAARLAGHPHRLYRPGDPGPNPYAGFLAWADAVVVTGDSVSMLSEALATAVPVFIADPGGLGPRHLRLAESLVAAGQARTLDAAPVPFARASLDETGRVAAAIRARGLW